VHQHLEEEKNASAFFEFRKVRQEVEESVWILLLVGVLTNPSDPGEEKSAQSADGEEKNPKGS